MDPDQLEHHALRNALYHTARRQRLETWGRFLNFIVILGGAGTVANLANSWLPKDWNLGIWLGLMITTIGALQLVFDFAGRARTHEILQRRYYDLLGRIKECGEPTSEQCNTFMAEIARISGEEPPTLRALDAVAYNEATDTIHGDAGAPFRLKVSWYYDFTKHMFHHNGVEFQPVGVPASTA